MDVDMSSVSSSSQSDKDCNTAIMLPESLNPEGPSGDAAYAAELAPVQNTSPDTEQAIGSYMTSAGINKTSFSSDLNKLPTVSELKNGNVLELFHYFTQTLGKSQTYFVKKLIVIGGHAEADVSKVVAYISQVVKKHKDMKRNLKGAKLRSGLEQLLDEEFCWVRSRRLKEPDTPRKERLREELSSVKLENKSLKRKLEVMEADLSATSLRCEALEAQLREAKQGKLIAETHGKIDALCVHGGFWGNPARIERECLRLQDKDEDVMKHAIHDQLQFLHKVLHVTPADKDILQLSKTVDEITIDFTKEEMKAHLIEVVQQFLQQPSRRDHQLDYSNNDSEDMTEQKENIRKRIMGIILEARKENRAIRCTQEHLESLTLNPRALIGKTVEVGQWDDLKRSARWMRGVVLGISKEDEDPVLTEFSMDFTPEFGDVENKEGWIGVLRPIEDLKNNAMIICKT